MSMWSKVILLTIMVLVGALTTLITKDQDLQCVANCDTRAALSQRQYFKQPIWQTDQVFAGESGCWAAVALSTAISNVGRILFARSTTPISRHESDALDASSLRLKRDTATRRIFMVALPALCDILSTTLLNLGLLFVAPSIYQMTRGSVVLFSACFSAWCLRRQVERYKWLALSLTVLGVVVVGLAGAMGDDDPKIVGDLLLSPPDVAISALDLRKTSSYTPSGAHALRTTTSLCIITVAQVFAAAQFVLEDSLLSHFPITPVKLVGYEGVAGLVVVLGVQTVAYLAYGAMTAGRETVFDMRAGWRQIMNHPRIYTAGVVMMGVTGLYNFLALTVTRSLSATHRTSIDAFRTVVIWIVGLVLGWESFKSLQLVGFMGLVVGNLIFNDVVRVPALWVVSAGPEDGTGDSRGVEDR